jgi:hypothetical protein
MAGENKDASHQALQQLRGIMDRSSRFISLNGRSGIWVGVIALIGAFIAHGWLKNTNDKYIGTNREPSPGYFDPYTNRLLILAVIVFAVAIAGARYFTYKQARYLQQKTWNNSSRQLLLQFFFPLLAGAVFTIVFIYYGCAIFATPICLSFYGLALISGSKHTRSEIRYVGMLDVALGCANLFFPAYGLYFWVIGFGLLHILYGAVTWNRHENLRIPDNL